MPGVRKRILPVKDSGRAQDAAHASQGTKAGQDQVILFRLIFFVLFFLKDRDTGKTKWIQREPLTIFNLPQATTSPHLNLNLFPNGRGALYNMGRLLREEMYHQQI